MIKNVTRFVETQQGSRLISGYLITKKDGSEMLINLDGCKVVERNGFFVFHFVEAFPSTSVRTFSYNPEENGKSIEYVRHIVQRGARAGAQSNFISVNDSAITTASTLSTNTWTTLINDNLGANTDEGNIPEDCKPFFDGTDSSIILTGLPQYSVIETRINLTVAPTAKDTSYDVRVLVTPPTGDAFSFIVGNFQVVRDPAPIAKAISTKFYIGEAIEEGSKVQYQINASGSGTVLTDGFFTSVTRVEPQ